MASNAPAEVIIKRVKSAGEHGHHGGAWKVAYADFVTAMMAFFLLLWLLNATTEVQKQGIADYFSPVSVSKTSGGSGGLLGGIAISSPGAMTSRTAIPAVTVKIEPSQGATQGDADQEGGANKRDFTAEVAGQTPTAKVTEEQVAAAEKVIKARDQELRAAENAKFDEAEKTLRKMVRESPQLKELENHLMIDRTPEGMRIQVIDRQGKPMFQSGSARLIPRTKTLLERIAAAIRPLPNLIRITGHTDSVPFKGKGGYDNWNLSADRAQASRKVLVASGLPAGRIEAVAGRAASDPLLPDDPKSPRNRRISILLLRTKPSPVPGLPGHGGTARSASHIGQPPSGLDRDWSGPRVR